VAARSLPVSGNADLVRRNGDALLIALAGVHAMLLFTAASVPLIAIGLWWNSNTIAHNFIHRPFFRSQGANRLFSIFLSLVLGIPQSYWRARHLQHHGEAEGRMGRHRAMRYGPTILFETILILALWLTLAGVDARFLFTVYLPGYAMGLGLCFLQGKYEHEGGTTSHYGRIYNTLFFNDGYHVEHHRRPHAHWTELRELRGEARAGARSSRWPAVLRWVDTLTTCALELLERVVLTSSFLQRFVLDRHERAFRKLLPEIHDVRRVTIVGGGLFPRTALILRRVLPDAALTVVEANAANLRRGRARLAADVAWIHASFQPDLPREDDLVVLPLAYIGDRGAIYRDPPSRRVIVHDWVWSRRGRGTIVSWLLLKRLNLIRR
jgi:hypothetical protein